MSKIIGVMNATYNYKGMDGQYSFFTDIDVLKKAKFEYDEAWRIITHPTPDVTSYDKDKAQIILDTFRNSLGALNE